MHGKMLRLASAIAPGALLVMAALVIAPEPAVAAGPATNCGGWLTRAPTSDDPNALNYTFQCNWGITAYSILVTRQPGDYATVDDFGADGLAYDTSGNPASGVGFGCAGQVPGNGINCSVSSGYLPAPDYVKGWFDTTQPYCAYIPKGSNQVVPQAIVQLVVTDTNGVQDGPFRLNVSPWCGPPPKPKVAAKPKPAKKKAAKRSSTTRTAKATK